MKSDKSEATDGVNVQALLETMKRGTLTVYVSRIALLKYRPRSIGQISDYGLSRLYEAVWRQNDLMAPLACAYAEFVFTDVLCPDFRMGHMYSAVAEFQARNRRKGGMAVTEP